MEQTCASNVASKKTTVKYTPNDERQEVGRENRTSDATPCPENSEQFRTGQEDDQGQSRGRKKICSAVNRLRRDITDC